MFAQTEVQFCQVTNPSPDNICTLEYRPVCAYKFVCLGASCEGVTVGNACGACEQEGYDYYTEGVCPGDEEEVTEFVTEFETEVGDEIIWCEIGGEEENTICTQEYLPVCAYYANEEFAAGETVSNGCLACLHGFDYFTQGACSDYENSEEEEWVETEWTEEPIEEFTWCVPLSEGEEVECESGYVPICGYREDGTRETVSNECVGCYHQGFSYFTYGECDSEE